MSELGELGFDYDVRTDTVTVNTGKLMQRLNEIESRLNTLESRSPRHCPLCGDVMSQTRDKISHKLSHHCSNPRHPDVSIGG